MRSSIILLCFLVAVAGCNSTTQATGVGIYQSQAVKIEVIDSPETGGIISRIQSEVFFNSESVAKIVWDVRKVEYGKIGTGVLADQYLRWYGTYRGQELRVDRVMDMTSIVSRPILKYEIYTNGQLMGVIVAPL